MLKYFYIYNIRVPAYGMFVIMGIVVCSCIALKIAKKENHKFSQLMLIGIAGGIGAIIGAKFLTIITSSVREGHNLLSWDIFMKAGYSYYGGLFGFYVFGGMICKRKKINIRNYAEKYIFLVPLLHFFYKIGCFMGGCCYGIPYKGIWAVTFPEGVNELSGISVFPVQLLESIVELLIAVEIKLLVNADKLKSPIGSYLFAYGATRFGIEFLRYHANGKTFSSGHIYSAICVILGLIVMANEKTSRREEK